MNKSQIKTFEILEYILVNGDRAVTPSELTQATGLNAPTCIRILEGLVAYGYVRKKSRREGYQAGPAAFSFGCGCGFYAEVIRKAAPEIRCAAEKLRHRVILTTAAAGRKFLLLQSDPTGGVPLGHAYDDFYSTTSGRMLLAHFPEDELTAYIAGHGVPGALWPEAADETSLRLCLAGIRSAPYYRFDDAEGNICLSVMLRLPEHPVVCLSSFGRSESEVAAVLESLTAAAAAISKQFTGVAPGAL